MTIEEREEGIGGSNERDDGEKQRKLGEKRSPMSDPTLLARVAASL